MRRFASGVRQLTDVLPETQQWRYNAVMNIRYLLLLCLPLATGAGERLPDSSSTSSEDDAAMAERFHAPPMDSGEMQSLYLKSPVQLENAEERGGMEAVTDEERYQETRRFLREQDENRIMPVPSLEQEPSPSRIPITPMREL